MSADQNAQDVSADRRELLEAWLVDFDRGWTPGALAEFSRRLKRDQPSLHKLALFEMVKVDIDRIWSSGLKKTVEEYLQEFAELGTAENVASEIVYAECEARRRMGQAVDGQQIRSRFPRQFDKVQKLMASATASRPAASIDTSRPGAKIDTWNEDAAQGVPLPEQFGRYRILTKLGEGAMGAVYLAHDPQLDRKVALKTPSFSGQTSPDLLERFYREARSAGTLRHANICPVFDVGEISGTHFITMAYIEGRPLADYIRADGVPQRTAAVLIRKLGLALEHAHQNGVVHRDLKPANIMLDAKHEPIVMDFGLARRDSSKQDARLSHTGALMGTPAYMPPEQARGQHDRVGPHSDIYSLGVIFFELLTGRMPFEGTLAMILVQIIHDAPPRPRELRPDLDPSLEAICLKMMAQQVSSRYGSMREVVDSLTDWLKGRRRRESGSLVASDSGPRVSETAIVRTEQEALAALFAAAKTEQASGSITSPAKARLTLDEPQRITSTRKRHRSLYILLMTSAAAASLIVVGVVSYVFTPDDAVRIEVNDPNLSVTVDGAKVTLGDELFAEQRIEPNMAHVLAVKVGDTLLRLNGSTRLTTGKYDGQYQLAVNLQGASLVGDRFTFVKGATPVLVISLQSAPLPAPPQEIDLLALLGPGELRQSEGNSLETAVNGNRIVQVRHPKGRFANRDVHVPYSPPDEYDLRIGLTRRKFDGGLGLAVTCVAPGNRKCRVYLDGYSGSGLYIDRQDYTHHEVNVRGKLFRVDEASLVVCQVRRTGISVIVDGTRIINWKGGVHRLAGMSATDPRIAIGAREGGFDITELKLIPYNDAVTEN